MLCLMDLEEVMVVEAAWDLDFGGALPPGLMSVWEEEDCRGVATFSEAQHPTPFTERQQALLWQHLLLPR